MRDFTGEGGCEDGCHRGVALSPYGHIGYQTAAGAFGVATGGICFHLLGVRQQFPDIHVLLGQDFLDKSESNPGGLANSPDGPHTTLSSARETAEVPVTSAGHTVRGDEPPVSVPPPETTGNVGREATRPTRVESKGGGSPSVCYSGSNRSAAAAATVSYSQQ